MFQYLAAQNQKNAEQNLRHLFNGNAHDFWIVVQIPEVGVLVANCFFTLEVGMKQR